MKDIFGTSIEPGDVACYPIVDSSKRQALTFAVVIKNDDINKRGHCILALPLHTELLKNKTYRFKREFNVDPAKIWVLRDLSVLPQDMVTKLQRGLELYHAQKQSEEKRKAKAISQRNLSAGERYRSNLKDMASTDSLFQQMQNDVMRI